MHSDWQSLRAHGARAFGDEPHGQLEAEIVDLYEQQSALVEQAVEHVIRAFASGSIRVPWAVVRKKAYELRDQRNPAADAGFDRERRIANAERWLRNAGVHCDRWEDVEDELFTVATGRERGHLHEWADDLLLRERMLKLWRELRPRGEQAEADELRRAEEWKANRERVVGAMRARRDRLDAAQTEATSERSTMGETQAGAR